MPLFNLEDAYTKQDELGKLVREQYSNPSVAGIKVGPLLAQGIGRARAEADAASAFDERRRVNDLLNAQLEQQQRALSNAITGYQFGRQQQFNQGFNSPDVQRYLQQFMGKAGAPGDQVPASPEMFSLVSPLLPVIGERERTDTTAAAEALRALASGGTSSLFPTTNVATKSGSMIPQTDYSRFRPEVIQAFERLGITFPTTSTGTNAPAGEGGVPANAPVPFGGLRAAAQTAVPAAASMATYPLVKAIPAVANRIPRVGPLAASILSGLLTSFGMQALDPQGGQAVQEHPVAGAAGAIGGSYGGYGLSKMAGRPGSGIFGELLRGKVGPGAQPAAAPTSATPPPPPAAGPAVPSSTGSPFNLGTPPVAPLQPPIIPSAGISQGSSVPLPLPGLPAPPGPIGRGSSVALPPNPVPPTPLSTAVQQSQGRVPTAPAAKGQAQQPPAQGPTPLSTAIEKGKAPNVKKQKQKLKPVPKV